MKGSGRGTIPSPKEKSTGSSPYLGEGEEKETFIKCRGEKKNSYFPRKKKKHCHFFHFAGRKNAGGEKKEPFLKE